MCTQGFRYFAKSVFLIFLFQCHLSCFSQDERFASDRPGLSDAPDLIVPGNWQIETGFDFSEYNHYQIWQLSTNTLKYGISKRLEARLDFGIQYNKSQKVYGTVGPSFGIKGLLLDGSRIIPKTAIIIEYYPPPFSVRQQASGLGLELCFSNNLKNNTIYYNVGYDWIDFSSRGTLNILLGYQRQFSKKFAAFSEFYVFVPSESFINYVTDIGTTYQLLKRLQLDLTIGLDLSKPNGNSFTQGGITYNF